MAKQRSGSLVNTTVAQEAAQQAALVNVSGSDPAAPGSRVAAVEGVNTAQQAALVACEEMLTSGGEPFTPASFLPTTGGVNVRLNGADVKCAFRVSADVDWGLFAESVYVAAMAAAGNLLISIKADDATAVDSNGELNGQRITDACPVMTANNAPSPNLVSILDSAFANAEVATFEAFQAMDGLLTGNGGRSNAVPSAGSPIYFVANFGTSPKILNVFEFFSVGSSFPTAFTIWGYNGIPSATNAASWVALANPYGKTWTAETDPGASNSRQYAVSNATAYQSYIIKVTGSTGGSYVQWLEIVAYAAVAKACPGTLLNSNQPLATLAVNSAATWLRAVHTAYQHQRKTCYWIEFAGTLGADFSLYAKTWNNSLGSEFPDSVRLPGTGTALKFTSDNWATQTPILHNNQPAMLSVVFNSSANHSPQLMFCRATHPNIFLPGGDGIQAIPPLGIVVGGAVTGGQTALEALTGNTAASVLASPAAAIQYNMYAFMNNGELDVQLSTIGRIINEGIECKAGTTSGYRWLGAFWPIARQGSYQAPIDVEDARLLAFPGMTKGIGKRVPYTTLTQEAIVNLKWRRWNGNNDYAVICGILNRTYLEYEALGNHYGSAQTLLGIGIDGEAPRAETTGFAFTNLISCRSTLKILNLPEGPHVFIPQSMNADTTTGGWYYYNANSNGVVYQSYTRGVITCLG